MNGTLYKNYLPPAASSHYNLSKSYFGCLHKWLDVVILSSATVMAQHLLSWDDQPCHHRHEGGSVCQHGADRDERWTPAAAGEEEKQTHQDDSLPCWKIHVCASEVLGDEMMLTGSSTSTTVPEWQNAAYGDVKAGSGEREQTVNQSSIIALK